MTLIDSQVMSSTIEVGFSFQARKKSITDVFVINLAAADFIFVATLPFWTAEIANGKRWASSLLPLFICATKKPDRFGTKHYSNRPACLSASG